MHADHHEKLNVTECEHRISNWLQSVLGTEVRTNLRERASRIVEEAIELAQVEGVTRSRCSASSSACTRGRWASRHQEIAGIQVCVLAYTAAADIDLAKVTNDEITRIEDPALIEKIRAKHAAKAAAGTAIKAKPDVACTCSYEDSDEMLYHAPLCARTLAGLGW
jgi:hypothetical protein